MEMVSFFRDHFFSKEEMQIYSQKKFFNVFHYFSDVCSRCGANSACVGCLQDACNPNTCEQPDAGICIINCGGPHRAFCVCANGYIRDKASGECVPLKCP